MGIFGGSFTKPGKGVSKEEAAKRNYFDMMGRHFFDLVKVNLLFVVCNLIFIAAAVLLAFPYFFEFDKFTHILFTEKSALLPPLPFVPFMLMGPFIAGLTYVIRNWARQEHAFLVSDFFEHTKKNLVQGLLLSSLNTVVIYSVLNAAVFYLRTGISTFTVLFILAVVLGLWMIMNFYTYTIMVTFKMKLVHILRNAFLLSLTKLPQNVFFLVIIVAVHVLLLWYVLPVWFILMGVVLIALTSFTMNYYSWHVISKYMMADSERIEEEVVFEDA